MKIILLFTLIYSLPLFGQGHTSPTGGGRPDTQGTDSDDCRLQGKVIADLEKDFTKKHKSEYKSHKDFMKLVSSLIWMKQIKSIESISPKLQIPGCSCNPRDDLEKIHKLAKDNMVRCERSDYNQNDIELLEKLIEYEKVK